MKCKVCGKRFKLEADKKYIYTKHPQGLNVLVEEDKHYECFDCPRCGCQNIVNIREGGIGTVKEYFEQIFDGEVNADDK